MSETPLQKVSKGNKVHLTDLIVQAFYGGERDKWLGLHTFCASGVRTHSTNRKKNPMALTTDLSFFKALAQSTNNEIRKNESAADFCERIYYASDYPSFWEIVARNFKVLPTLTANRQVGELQKWGRTLLMMPFWHVVLTRSWNKSSLETKSFLRGKNGDNIRAQLEGLQVLKNYLGVFYALQGSVGLTEILNPRGLLPTTLGGRKARTSYFLGNVNQPNMKKLKLMKDCIDQISQLVELNGGMIDQMNQDKDIDLFWFKIVEQKRKDAELAIKRRQLAIDEMRNNREIQQLDLKKMRYRHMQW